MQQIFLLLLQLKSGLVSVRNLSLRGDVYRPFIDAYHAGLWAMFVLSNKILCLHKPVVKMENERLHCKDGPAIAFDRREYFFWRGIEIPREIVENPITPKQIESCSNSELRRVMIERYGFDKYLEIGGFIEMQRDHIGILYRKEGGWRDPAMQFVKVVNKTKEPDGTFKEYVIPVSNRAETAHEGIANSFGLTVETYNPMNES